MPNWCYNFVEVSGNAKDLALLKEQVKGEETALDFNKVVPYPKEYSDLDKVARVNEDKRREYAKQHGKEHTNDLTQKQRDKAFELYPDVKDGYNQGGHQWCIANWGTKWNVDASCQGEPTDGSITYTFDTAWGPSLRITKRLGEQYPKLKFFHKYSEPGMCFYGEFKVEDGKVVIDDCFDMPTFTCKNCNAEQTMDPDEVNDSDCWECGECNWVKK